MKLRIKGNSLRIRLSRSEVDEFGRAGYLEERTEFGNGIFTYILQNEHGINGLSANFSGSSITVLVPSEIVREWTTTEKVGFENNMDIAGGKQLFILIEKDFKCVDNTTEDQSDNYEHPTSTCD
jgi:uncharacterized protein DUF7009